MSFVSTDLQDGVCVLRLSHGKPNSISEPVSDELMAALAEAEKSADAVVLLGQPGMFSGGFDLPTMAQGPAAAAAMVKAGGRLLLSIYDHPKPIVVGCTGHAVAMGLFMVMAGDYRVGAGGAFKLLANETAIGMTLPYFGVELARARLDPAHFELSVSCAYLYDAVGAVEAGYLDESVGADQTMSRARQVATQLSGLNMDAHKATKDRVREPLNQAMEEAVAKELGG